MYQDNSDTTTNENIGTLFSTWVTLQAGQKYYIETSHFFQGTSHLTVGVEIEPASGPVANHPKTKPQRQSLTLTHKLTRDETELRVRAADGNQFIMFYIKPDLEYWFSDEIIAGCSANELKNAISGYYTEVHGV